MKLVSVNIAHTGTPLENGKPMPTGIFKRPTLEPVRVERLGLEGDFIGDTANHGGPNQAIYVYSLEDYAWWSGELGRELEPGTFGENLTFEGLDFSEVNLGDCFTIGNVLLEVAFPRIPCRTLAARMQDLGFVRSFVHAERPGVYCRVLELGQIQVGLEVKHLPVTGIKLSAKEVFRFWHSKRKDWGVLERALAAGQARDYFEPIQTQRGDSL